MANRIYIAIGLVAILILGAAFVVPRFIDWNAYKARMEEMAAGALGVEVAIAGDMDFVLLPQPRLHMESVRIGPAGAPVGEARLVEADFSLMDFLRDRFTVTQLRLIEPRLNLVVDENGALRNPITLAETAIATNVSIANARFSGGTVAITDLRSGESWQAEGFSGDMQMAAIRGPFLLSGQARYEGTTYGVRLTTSPMNADGHMQISAALRPVGGAFTASVEGLLETGDTPSFAGQASYRRPGVASGEEVVGDLVLQSPVSADPDAVRFEEFTLLPDENHAAVRLTGTASVTLGASPRFDASISGGVVTLLPNGLAEEGARPYELVRLLREMPQPPMPPLPGRIGMRINELGVRGIGLRDVRLDATTDGDIWSVEEFSGRLSGDSTLKLTGTLGRSAGWPAFEGTLALATQRLDALALLWRRAGEGNPLFGMGGSLNGRLQLINDRLRLTDGVFVLDGVVHTVSGDMRFGDAPSLAVTAELADLNRSQSAALLALLPPLEPAGAFGLSFPQGRLDLSVAGATVAGQRVVGLVAGAGWSAGGVAFDTLSVESFGGIGFEGTGRLAGTIEAPAVEGAGRVEIAANAGALDLVLGTGHPLRRAVLGSLPATLDVTLEPPGRDGAQSLSVSGLAGAVEVSGAVEMARGVTGFGSGPVEIAMDAAADSGEALLGQLGIAPIIAGPDGAIASARLAGNPQGTMEAELSLEGGGERIDFSGTLIVSDLSAIRGQGRTSFLFEDSTVLSELAGATGVWLPAIEGQAELGFVGTESVTLSQIAAHAGERAVSGEVTYAAQREGALVTGALGFDMLDIETLAAMLAGPAAVLELSPGLWPDGPVDLGASPRGTRGRIAVTAPALLAGERRLVEALAFDYAWGNEDAGLRGLFGEFGGGTVQLDATLCCASTLASKSLTGRVTFNGVALDAILPAEAAGALDGTLTLGAQFQGSGETLRELAGSLNGEGSFSVGGLAVEGLSPSAFDAAANVENLIEIAPETLEVLVAAALGSGAFTAEEAGGLVRLIGGEARVANVAIEGNGARLVGGGGLDLETARLSGDWTLALTRALGGNGLITETTGRIGVGISGTLLAPERRLDLGPMVDAIQMRAYELELDELEALRAAQEARQRAAAEEQARLMEEEARRQAEQLLLQQQQEAERLQLEEEQRRLQEIEEMMNQQPSGGAATEEPAAGSGAQNGPVFLPGVLELPVVPGTP